MCGLPLFSRGRAKARRRRRASTSDGDVPWKEGECEEGNGWFKATGRSAGGCESGDFIKLPVFGVFFLHMKKKKKQLMNR